MALMNINKQISVHMETANKTDWTIPIVESVWWITKIWTELSMIPTDGLYNHDDHEGKRFIN
jgi:hypothetical protein